MNVRNRETHARNKNEKKKGKEKEVAEGGHANISFCSICSIAGVCSVTFLGDGMFFSREFAFFFSRQLTSPFVVIGQILFLYS